MPRKCHPGVGRWGRWGHPRLGGWGRGARSSDGHGPSGHRRPEAPDNTAPSHRSETERNGSRGLTDTRGNRALTPPAHAAAGPPVRRGGGKARADFHVTGAGAASSLTAFLSGRKTRGFPPRGFLHVSFLQPAERTRCGPETTPGRANPETDGTRPLPSQSSRSGRLPQTGRGQTASPAAGQRRWFKKRSKRHVFEQDLWPPSEQRAAPETLRK